MSAIRFLTALLLAGAAFAASAQMYRWTDDKGKVHYTSTPPPAGAKNVQKKGSAGAAEESSAPALPYSVQKAQTDFPVTLYTTPGCEGCDAARKRLNCRGLPFKEVVLNQVDQLAQLKAVAGSHSVPTIVVGRTVQHGLEEGSYNRLLDEAG